MDFVVTSRHHGERMYPGQIITYIIRPVLGVPLKWCTEITHVENMRYFVDEQRFGPYAFWHHQHHFRKVDGGILMEDILHYKIPYGPLGLLADALFVGRQVRGIFDYRMKVLTERFGALP
ncbi:SRPBCC family protein [Dyadobacter helix]|nr:SRPBCC family protein [Dyadobacter sp. CECT 9275]